MQKKELLEHWSKLPNNQPILPVMSVLPYKHEGKTFGLCGIRIDGSMEFIDAVLSRLQDLLDGENHVTRLQASLSDCSKAEGDFNKGNGGNVCYIRLAMRGREASIASGFFDRHLDKPTASFAKAVGIDPDSV